MRRILSLIAALVLCIAVMSPVMVSADPFVPSISYKDGPEIIEAEMEDEDVTECIVVTSILEAEEQSTDIDQETRDELLEVYEALSDGTMELPLPECYVVRELVDVSFTESGCIEPDHPHEEQLEEEGVTITVDFDLGIEPGVEVVVMVYIDGEWTPIESVVNNGDGTLTCVFERFCPVAFCISECGSDGPAQTGDPMGQTLYLWLAVLTASLMGLLVLTVPAYSRKK